MTRTIFAQRTIDRPINELFAVLSDHARYDRFPGVDAAELVKPGESEPNGLGAIRKIRFGLVTLTEVITRFEPPHRMDYRITHASPLSIRHPRGEILLQEEEAGTRVQWTSEFGVRFPLLGPLMDRMLAPTMERGFSAILKSIERP